MPFDRLVRAVDQWAGSTGRRDIFAQIGAGGERPVHLEWREFIEPAEHRQRLQSASLVIGHAGMGTIISALELGVPVLVMPRRAELREHRNDHQVATARRFEELGKVTVAYDEHSLRAQLEHVDQIRVRSGIEAGAADALLGALRRFVAEAASRRDPGASGPAV